MIIVRLFVDMDGTIAKWNNVAFEQLYEKGYYRNLEPDNDILQEVKMFIETGFDVYILSAYLPDVKDEKTGKLIKKSYALDEKKEWVREYLPELKEKNAIFVPYGTNKAEYLRDNYSPVYKNDYLLDDYTKNLDEWTGYGGTGIKYKNGINGTKGTWKGLFITKESPDLVSAIGEVRTLINKVNWLYDTHFYSMQDVYNFLGCLDAVQTEIIEGLHIEDITSFEQLLERIDDYFLSRSSVDIIDDTSLVDIHLDDCSITVKVENGCCTIPDIEMYDNVGTLANISYTKATDLAQVLNYATTEHDLCIEEVNQILDVIDSIKHKDDEWQEHIDLVDKLCNLDDAGQLYKDGHNVCEQEYNFCEIEYRVAKIIDNYISEIINEYCSLQESFTKAEFDDDFFITGAIYNCDELYLKAIADVVGIEYVQEQNEVALDNEDKEIGE